MGGPKWGAVAPTVTVLLLVAVGAAVVLGYAGLRLGDWFVDRFMPWAELEGLGPVAAGSSLGVWTGAALGSWLALRLLRRPAAGLTALVVAGLMPVWLLVPIGIPWFTNVGPSLPLTVASFVMAIPLAGALALAAARAGSSGRQGAIAASLAATLAGAMLWGLFFFDISRG